MWNLADQGRMTKNGQNKNGPKKMIFGLSKKLGSLVLSGTGIKWKFLSMPGNNLALKLGLKMALSQWDFSILW